MTITTENNSHPPRRSPRWPYWLAGALACGFLILGAAGALAVWWLRSSVVNVTVDQPEPVEVLLLDTVYKEDVPAGDIVIDIDRGVLVLDGLDHSLDALDELISAAAVRNPDTGVYVRGQHKFELNEIEMVNRTAKACKRAGLEPPKEIKKPFYGFGGGPASRPLDP